MPSEELSLLIRTRELLSDPRKWTKHTRARDDEGRRTDSCSPAATRWCLLGALDRCENREKMFEISISNFKARIAMELCMDKKFNWFSTMNTCITGFNDDTSTNHADVLSLLDRTIDMLRENENGSEQEESEEEA